MRTKFSRILIVVLIVTVALCVLVACGSNEQSLDGLVIVTFDFKGGNLDNSATIVYDLIKHAYKPNSLVINIATYKNNKFTKSGYVFEGWYTKDGTESGDWGKQWNFSTDRVTEDMTLYARWETAIVFSYTLFLDVNDNEGNPIQLGQYKVNKGDVFKDSRNYGTRLDNYNRTFLGYYSDAERTTEWNFETITHPGGDESVDVPVYVKSMEGVWTLVSSYDELRAATGKNIWLTQNIDCGGKELYLGDYNNTLQGNNFTISNFKVTNSHSNDSRMKYVIFGELGANAKILNVTFDQVYFEIKSAFNTWEIRTGALALSAEVSESKDENNQTVYNTCVIENVTVNGFYTVDLTEFDSDTTEQALLEAIAKITEPFYEPNDKVDTSGLTINIIKQD